MHKLYFHLSIFKGALLLSLGTGGVVPLPEGNLAETTNDFMDHDRPCCGTF